jgi:hypothetical protein
MKRKLDLQVALSAKGLANIPRNIYENDFTFILGEDKYQCPSFIAAFLSPRIVQLQVSDSTLREFVIVTKDPEHYFHNFICLAESCRMTVAHQNSEFFRSIYHELWNEDGLNSIIKCYGNDMTRNTVCDRLTF